MDQPIAPTTPATETVQSTVPVTPVEQKAVEPKAEPSVAKAMDGKPVEPAKKGNPMKKMMWAFLAIIVLGAVAGVSFYFGMQKGESNQLQALMEKTKELVAKQAQVTKAPTPGPTAQWLSFTNAKYQYSVKYPPTLKATEDNTSYHFVTFASSTSAAALPAFLISVIPETFTAKDVAAYNYMSSDFITTLSALKLAEAKTMGTVTFTKLPDVMVNGQPALAVEVATSTYKQQRVYVKAKGNIYMVSNTYYKPEELSDFTLFLSTFKLTQ